MGILMGSVPIKYNQNNNLRLFAQLEKLQTCPSKCISSLQAKRKKNAVTLEWLSEKNKMI